MRSGALCTISTASLRFGVWSRDLHAKRSDDRQLRLGMRQASQELLRQIDSPTPVRSTERFITKLLVCKMINVAHRNDLR